MTQAQIESILTEQATALNMTGIVSDSLVKLLAYAIYINDSTINSKLVNNLFPSATTLNSRIAHANSMLYSVYRGTNTKVAFSNILPVRTTEYKYLDSAFQYSGTYFYFDQDYTNITKGSAQTGTIRYVISDKPIKTATVSTSADYQFVDINESNISESFRLFGDDGVTPINTTSDAYEFFTDIDSDGNYVHKYLVVTLPNYGVRIIKRYNEAWENSALKLEYLVYSETKPDLSALRSLGDFKYVEKDDSNFAEQKYTTYSVISYLPRLEDLEIIYNNATRGYLCRNQIGSIDDIKYFIGNTQNNDGTYIDVYNVTSLANTPPMIYAKVTSNDTSTAIRNTIEFRTDYDHTTGFDVVAMTPRNITLNMVIEGGTLTTYEITNALQHRWQLMTSVKGAAKSDGTGFESVGTLTLSQIYAAIIKLDPEITSIYCKSAAYSVGTETETHNISTSSTDPLGLEFNEYYNITIATATTS